MWPGVPAIHHSLGHVDARSGHIALIVYIGNFIHRSAVDSHAQRKLRMLSRLRLISRAQRTGASGVVKKASAIPSPVAKRTSLPAASAARNCGVFRNNVAEHLKYLLLIVAQQLIPDDVREQHVRSSAPNRADDSAAIKPLYIRGSPQFRQGIVFDVSRSLSSAASS